MTFTSVSLRFSWMLKNSGTDESVPVRSPRISKITIRTVDRSVCPRVFPQPVRLCWLGLCGSVLLLASGYKAGIATVTITPSQPIYLSGYANRTHASDGVVHDLKAKALAIEDKSRGRLVIVTTDLI